jgi:hypothetical protein
MEARSSTVVQYGDKPHSSVWFGRVVSASGTIRSKKTADDSPKRNCRNAAQSAVNQGTKRGALEPRRDIGTWLSKPWRSEDKAD